MFSISIGKGATTSFLSTFTQYVPLARKFMVGVSVFQAALLANTQIKYRGNEWCLKLSKPKGPVKKVDIHIGLAVRSLCAFPFSNLGAISFTTLVAIWSGRVCGAGCLAVDPLLSRKRSGDFFAPCGIMMMPQEAKKSPEHHLSYIDALLHVSPAVSNT